MKINIKFQKGLFTSVEGGIYYVNIKMDQQLLLVGTPNPSQAFKLNNLNENFTITNHEDGKLKLFTVTTGEELHCYKMKAICTAVSFDQKNQRAICFFENNNEIKLLDLNKIGQVETFQHDEVVGTARKAEDYVISCNELLVDNIRCFVLVMRSGDIFIMDIDSSKSSLIIFKVKI